MSSSGRGTTLGIDGSRFGPVLPHGGSGNLQVTCVSELWFSSLEAGLIVRGVVGMMGGGVYASVCTGCPGKVCSFLLPQSCTLEQTLGGGGQSQITSSPLSLLSTCWRVSLPGLAQSANT